MDWAEAIRELTAPLSHVQAHYAGGVVSTDATLAEDLHAYIRDGGDSAVVRRVGYEHLRVLTVSDRRPLLQRFYGHLGAVPPDVVVRWAGVLEAYGYPLYGLEVNGTTWPATLLTQIGVVYPEGELPVSFPDLTKVLEAGNLNADELLVNAWEAPDRHNWRRHGRSKRRYEPEHVLARTPGYERAVSQLHQRLAPRLVDGNVEGRVHALSMLAPVDDITLGRYAEQVAAAAASSSAQVRESAVALVLRLGDAGTAQVRRLATEAKPDQRRHALQLLWDIGDDETRAFARETALADRAASVRTVADGFADAAPTHAAPVPEVSLPRSVDWVVEWTDELAAALSEYVEDVRHWSPAPGSVMGNTRITPREVITTLRRQLTSPGPVTSSTFRRNYQFSRSAAIGDALTKGVLPTAGLVKLLVSGDLLTDPYRNYADLRWSTGLLHQHHGLTLLELAAHLQDLPEPDAVEVVVQGWFHDQPGGLGRDWDRSAVWPFFARHLDAFLGYWQRRRAGHSFGFDSEALFPLVDSFPEPPTRLVELCYDLALGSAKSDRRAAQDFLSTHAEAVPRATAALANGNGTIRAEAASWLGRIGDRAAVPALAAAFAKEKNETAQGALLDALVALGERLEDHFDLAAVDAQAEKAMAKGLPAALTWLDPERLPDVRRANRSGTVPRSTMLWLVARATAAKSSVPGALLRACTAQLDAADQERFADTLLAMWIATDEESVGRTSYGRVLRAETTSGAASKGLLAVVAAGGGARSVSDAVRYVRTWHGQRAALSKALVTMLAHHRHPAAIEAVVAIAYRFKAPSIERTAREEVAELAERLGWTTDQLADRTVATAGFDEHGVLALSYGERTFTARLLPDCGIELLDPHGKVIKALPAARQSDDTEAAKEARKSLSAAKKQLAETVQIQTARLHDALCAQRSWTGADWHTDLAGHPVLARLVSRLVWVADAGDIRLTFRLLDDGTLTGVDDEPVTLPDDAVVRMAHDVTLTDAEVESWQQHLTDYEVPSLFWQLGRGRPQLTDEQAAETVLDAGRVAVPAGRLQQTTTRLGYRRGAVGDGATYDWFEKEFASLGLKAMLNIDGQGIEDHESEATVEGLVVESMGTGQRVPLGELPPVLLVELRHDLAVVVGA